MINPATIRENRTVSEFYQLIALPFMDLLFQVQIIHRIKLANLTVIKGNRGN